MTILLQLLHVANLDTLHPFVIRGVFQGRFASQLLRSQIGILDEQLLSIEQIRKNQKEEAQAKKCEEVRRSAKKCEEVA
ncbi:MAG: hypothetical protein D6765_11280 [Bacteroidetes bacterium]|nr:MAG: hypothetical protein D6765_11280 [Bacteroidota bacterium]